MNSCDTDPDLLALHQMAERTKHSHFRLSWVAGKSSLERSRLIGESAKCWKQPVLNVGRALSSALSEIAAPLRAASVEDTFFDLLRDSKADVVCLDHLEILFDQGLKMNALDLVRNASRRFTIIASWPGVVDGEFLIFASPDHPSHCRIPFHQMECPVHVLN